MKQALLIGGPEAGRILLVKEPLPAVIKALAKHKPPYLIEDLSGSKRSAYLEVQYRCSQWVSGLLGYAGSYIVYTIPGDPLAYEEAVSSAILNRRLQRVQPEIFNTME